MLVCFCIGVIPLLLLNGQTFTNTLIALPFFLIPIVLCAAFALDRRTPEGQKRAWRLATMLMALLAIASFSLCRGPTDSRKGSTMRYVGLTPAHLNP